MCRSIKTLRPPYAEQVTDEDIRAAALRGRNAGVTAYLPWTEP